METHDPTSEAKHKDYDRSDLEHFFERKPFDSWDQAIDWLKREGDADNELTPGEVRHMIDDFERAREQGAPYNVDAAAKVHDH